MLILLSKSVNKAMQKDTDEISIGILDIYGFEIFKVSILTSPYVVLIRANVLDAMIYFLCISIQLFS